MTSPEIKSPIKREKLKKLARLKLRQDMRAALPVLDKDQVRRFRLPYHEAVLLELEEQGFISATEFLKQLINYQEDLRRQHGPNSAIWDKPRLIECKEQLDKLYKGLKNAEAAHYVDDIGTECDELIKLGVAFGMGTEDWWWLGEQLLLQSVNVSSEFQKDGGQRETISKYIYGKFLLENLLDADQAKSILTESRQLSIGQNWSASKQLGYKQESIFIESCILLYRALLAEAKHFVHSDPLKAARICVIAKKRATNACDHRGEAEALMLQGVCEMEAGDASAAIVAFIKVLALYNKLGDPADICDARIDIALAYLKLGNVRETLKHLQLLLEFAETKELPYYIAQAYRFLGEYYLNQGTPSSATPLLIKALHIFHELEDMLNREQARNLAAISAGQELIAKYVELILKCGRDDLRGTSNVLKLVRWKDTRELFWSEDDDISSKSTETFEQSLLNLSAVNNPYEVIEEEKREEEEEHDGDELPTDVEMIDADAIDDDMIID